MPRRRRMSKVLTVQVFHQKLQTTVWFKLSYTTKLKKVMHAYCDKLYVPHKSLLFLFKKTIITSRATPNKLKMKNNDIIHVTCRQMGCAKFPDDNHDVLNTAVLPLDSSISNKSLGKQAGLQCFPVKKTTNEMSTYMGKVSIFAGVYLTAVLEYMVAEVLELAGNACKHHSNESMIEQQHVCMAIKSDKALKTLITKNAKINAMNTVKDSKNIGTTVKYYRLSSQYMYSRIDCNININTIQHAVRLFIETKFGESFHNIVSEIKKRKRKKDGIEVDTFEDIACGVRLLVDIISIPSIFQRVCLTKQSFNICWQIMSAMEDYRNVFIRQDNAVDIVLLAKTKNKYRQIFTMLCHRGNKLKHLKWILGVNNGKLFENYVMHQFMTMSKFNCKNICYFAIYVSWLVFKYRKKLTKVSSWNNVYVRSPNGVQQYQDYVVQTFSDANNQLRRMCKKLKSKYSLDIIEHRNRIFCENRKCHIGFYDHIAVARWYRCKRCKIVYYCSRHCQKIDWNNNWHKPICNVLTV
eukprot:236500_1